MSLIYHLAVSEKLFLIGTFVRKKKSTPNFQYLRLSPSGLVKCTLNSDVFYWQFYYKIRYWF